LDSSLSHVLTIILIILIIVALLVVIAAYFAVRQIQRFFLTDSAKLQRQLDQLRAENPRLNTDALMRKLINSQSLKCGLVGAIAALGGFVTLPIALPIDILLSMRIQATMVQFIAAAYDQTNTAGRQVKLQTQMVMAGSVEVTETATSLIMRFVLRLLGESLSLLIPLIGSLVGFGVNYAIAQATGHMALRFYSANSR